MARVEVGGGPRIGVGVRMELRIWGGVGMELGVGFRVWGGVGI